MSPLLRVEKLRVEYRLPNGQSCPALEGVTFDIQYGETVGVLGESGSGKSTLAAALLGLLPGNARPPAGVVLFEGQNLLEAKPADLRKVRGSRIGLVFQEASLALHPTIRVGEQVRDVIAAQQNLSRIELRDKALLTLRQVFSEDVARIAESYPHQLSGGQRSRVLIAQAIACQPALLIADEPTASLDPQTQYEIVSLLRSLRSRFQMAQLFITHNPALLPGLADRVLVLYAGRIAELGSTPEVLTFPRHPYTSALLQCRPPQIGNGDSRRKQEIPVIPGEAPDLVVLDRGCRFEPRCSYRMDVCSTREPAESIMDENRAVACFKYGG